MSSLLLKNIYTLMTSSEEKDQHGVDVLIKDNVVFKIGNDINERADRTIDASNLVVVPGFVNTHHHFYQTLTRALPEVQNSKLFVWLTYLYEIWKRIDEEAVSVSSLLAMSELMKTGCTCTTDHHYVYPKGFSGDAMQLQFDAAEKLGMRFSPTRGSMSLSKKDGGLPPDSVVQTEDEILSDSERVIRKFHDPSDLSMRKVVLAPCSPFSVTKSLMTESAKLARKYSVRLHTHLCETIDEEDTCMKMYGVRPLELMAESGLIGNDVFYAHGIHFNDAELKVLKETGSQIAHCPSSNMRLGSGICRVREMLDLGITVGLGVDGSASNDSSDMLGEMRMALLLQRVKYGSDSLSTREVFKMASENGAKMLGYEKIGRIKEGWGADIACFDVSGIPYAGAQADPVASLIFTGISHEAKYTIINGKVTVDDGKVVGIDENELAGKANEIARRLLEG